MIDARTGDSPYTEYAPVPYGELRTEWERGRLRRDCMQVPWDLCRQITAVEIEALQELYRGRGYESEYGQLAAMREGGWTRATRWQDVTPTEAARCTATLQPRSTT